MNTRRSHKAIISFSVLCALWGGLGYSGQRGAAKLQPEEIVARNLASIGTSEARATVRNRCVTGSARMIYLIGGHGEQSGKGALCSEGHNIRFGMTFAAPGYPGEQIAFDGKQVTVGQIQPGQRSTLEGFLGRWDNPITEGFFGGAMSVAWTLLDLPGRKVQFEYSGLKKIEGKNLHELTYRPKNRWGDLRFSLYFELQSYRHVRSEYRLLPSKTGLGDTRVTLIEAFNDFRAVEGLTLPHTYKLNMTVESQISSFIAVWTIQASQVLHNQTIDPKTFIVK